LASVTEQPPQTAEGRPPDWAPVPEKPPLTRRGEVTRIVLRAGIALAIAALLWALGREPAALVLLAVCAVATIASLRSPAVAAAIDRGTAAIQRWAGRVLGVVLLGAVELLVFIPVGLVLRVARHDPLALGAEREAPTFWRPTPRRPGHGPGAGLYRRPFGYEYAKREGVGRGRLPLLRVRAVLGLVALLVLLDVAAGALIDALVPERPTTPFSLLTHPDAAAGRGEPWIRPLGTELSWVWSHRRYDPFLAWTSPDYAGRYVHVRDGVRRSAEPAAGRAGGRPLDVVFFGGSAMFGLFQRDGHTIPSDLARLAAADGIRLRVVNRGMLGYTNWQEVLLLQQLLTKGQVPDLAVFYDGFNELLAQFQLGTHTDPTHVGAAIMASRWNSDPGSPPLGQALHDAWAKVSLAHRLARETGLADPLGYRRPSGVSAWTGPQDAEPLRRGANAAAIHARGVALARRLARSYGFRTAFFWQPDVYSKRIRAGEETLEGYLGADPKAWDAADRGARANLRPPVRDFAGALDGVRRPVMYDFVHTNEAGARAVAERIYAELRPTLRSLAERERP
jgi:lysophospholipase L1-like esterase